MSYTSKLINDIRETEKQSTPDYISQQATKHALVLFVIYAIKLDLFLVFIYLLITLF